VEDLISTGKSSLQVVDALRQASLDVQGMVSIFTYGFDTAREAFEKSGVPYFSLTNYPVLLGLAIEKGIVNQQQESILLKWKDNPSGWTGF
jgi:orotate phosphoribosyltransferase